MKYIQINGRLINIENVAMIVKEDVSCISDGKDYSVYGITVDSYMITEYATATERDIIFNEIIEFLDNDERVYKIEIESKE